MKLSDYRLKNCDGSPIKRFINTAIGNIVLLLIDETKMPEKKSQKNLLAIDDNEEIIWIADLPSGASIYSRYETVDIYGSDKIAAFAGSYRCIIDIKTGKITEERFIK